MTALQLVVLGILCLFTINLVLNLRALTAPLRRPCPFPSTAPHVSVLIPARNEEETIGRCVTSLLAQDYPSFEVLVFDDQSTDGTTAIVTEIAQADSRLRLLHGDGPPHGWAGKPYACVQLARAAAGDYLLFVDADTTHRPAMLKTIVPRAVESGAMIVSGYPRQIVKSFIEISTVPVVYFFLLLVLPLTVRIPGNHPPRSFTIGQFILFPRELYWGIGGHEAVKSRILEDMFLGIEARKAGGRLLTLNLSDVTCCRMYRNARSVWEGCRKWGFAFALTWPGKTLALEFLTALLFLGPLVALLVGLILPGASSMFVALSGAQVGVILIARAIYDRSLKMRPLAAALSPVGIVVLLAAFITGSVARFTGGGASWKGRKYGSGNRVG
ncbi:MAG: glycosyltransferase [Chloroflexota bacterium]